MHEFSICESIVKAALDEINSRGIKGRLVAVRVVAGEMHNIVPDCLTLAYEALAKGTAAEGARLDVRTVPVSVECRRCGRQDGIKMPFFRCRHCGSVDVDVRAGRELYLENLEIEDNDESEH